MKDTIITSDRKKKELKIVSFCFVLSNAMNIVAIIVYHTAWTEVFSMIGYVLGGTIVLYVMWICVRVMLCWLRIVMKKLLAKK
jgi:hypothetical protein